MSRSSRGVHTDRRSGSGARATAVLRFRAIQSRRLADHLPLALIAGYLNRYGLQADAVRITSRRHRRHLDRPDVRGRAESGRAAGPVSGIPLQRTAEIAVRRLADHLREIGWDTALVVTTSIPSLIDAGAQETWRAVMDGPGDYVAGLSVGIDAALADTLAGFGRPRPRMPGPPWRSPAPAISGPSQRRAPCAPGPLRTALRRWRGWCPQQGNQRTALLSLHPLSGPPGRPRRDLGRR